MWTCIVYIFLAIPPHWIGKWLGPIPITAALLFIQIIVDYFHAMNALVHVKSNVEQIEVSQRTTKSNESFNIFFVHLAVISFTCTKISIWTFSTAYTNHQPRQHVKSFAGLNIEKLFSKLRSTSCLPDEIRNQEY